MAAPVSLLLSTAEIRFEESSVFMRVEIVSEKPYRTLGIKFSITAFDKPLTFIGVDSKVQGLVHQEVVLRTLADNPIEFLEWTESGHLRHSKNLLDCARTRTLYTCLAPHRTTGCFSEYSLPLFSVPSWVILPDLSQRIRGSGRNLGLDSIFLLRAKLRLALPSLGPKKR